MLCMCDDTCQINVLYHTTTKCRHRYVDQQTCTICTYTMQNMKCKHSNYVIFVWLTFCTLSCAVFHVMHVRWCAANKRFVPHNKNAAIDTLINKVVLFVHTSFKTWNVSASNWVTLLGYHFAHCFVRLFMLCMCDDVRQINVLCRTTKNAAIDTLIKKFVLLFMHTWCKSKNVNAIIMLFFLG